MSKKFLFYILLFIVLIGICFCVWFYFFSQKEPVVPSLFSLPPSSPSEQRLVEVYEKALEYEDNINQDSENWQNYLNAAINWKILGDATKQEEYYQRADEIYQKASDKSGETNYLLFTNWGDLVKLLGDFDRAEQYYKTAIEISPVREQPYLHLAELYEYNLKKDSEEVIQVYTQGLIATGYNLDILIQLASFFEKIGRKQEALNMWKLVLERVPEDEIIKQRIEELESEQ